MTRGERLVLTIIIEEMRCRGFIELDSLAARLNAYLDDQSRRHVLADAVLCGGEPGASLLDAFLLLLPVDQAIAVDDRGGLKLVSATHPPRRH